MIAYQEVSVMPSLENNMMLLSTYDQRSVNSRTPSPSREVIKGIRLFRAISRRLARRSADDIHLHKENNYCEDDCRSSSPDSCSSTTAGRRCSRKQEGDSGFRSVSPNNISSNSSEDGSEINIKNRHHHSTSAESIRKVFQSLIISTRSQSCSNTKDTKRKANKKVPKRILRSPVPYTYVKGMSGLPTQRIPLPPSRTYLNSSCPCTIQYVNGINGLNR